MTAITLTGTLPLRGKRHMPTFGDTRRLVAESQRILGQDLAAFPQIEPARLAVDRSVDLAQGVDGTGVGRGRQNLGIFRARLSGDVRPLVIKYPVIRSHLLDEVRGIAVFSLWGCGPAFIGLTSGRNTNGGIVMREIENALPTKSIGPNNILTPAPPDYVKKKQLQAELARRMNERTLDDVARLRVMARSLAMCCGVNTLQALVQPNGTLLIIDVGQILFQTTSAQVGISVDTLIMWMYIRQWIPHEQFTDKELARLYVQSNIHAAVKSTQRYLKVSPAGVTIDLSINDIYLQYEALIDEATALITAHREDVCS